MTAELIHFFVEVVDGEGEGLSLAVGVVFGLVCLLEGDEVVVAFEIRVPLDC